MNYIIEKSTLEKIFLKLGIGNYIPFLKDSPDGFEIDENAKMILIQETLGDNSNFTFKDILRLNVEIKPVTNDIVSKEEIINTTAIVADPVEPELKVINNSKKVTE